VNVDTCLGLVTLYHVAFLALEIWQGYD
jgi:hypothetical protein